jgi:hypothetical protein
VKKSKRPNYASLPAVELPHTLEVAVRDYCEWADDYFRSVEKRREAEEPAALREFSQANRFGSLTIDTSMTKPN